MASNNTPNLSKMMQWYLLDDATVPRRTVRLHNLCSACRSFGENVDNRNLPSKLYFGSVSRLDPDNCHLCAMIEAFRSNVSNASGRKPPEDAMICFNRLPENYEIYFSKENESWFTLMLRLEYFHGKGQP
jgi:hypothetical protein